MKLIGNLWYGTEESYFAFLHAQDRIAALEAAGPEAIKAAVITAGGGRGDDPFQLPSLWQAQDGVAVLNIDGTLVNGYAGFGRLFGVIGYGDIQEALGQIAADKNTKTVLLNIDSGGGQVDGVEETGDMIRALDGQKPVLSYTGGTMGSAAYWLGSSAREVGAARTAQVGSVGTLIVHSERSAQRAEAGIKDTVIRYGKYKALGNPIEPLSDDGKEQLQALADESGKIFVDYVADRRGMSASAFQKTAGEGRVFMGNKAKEVGLIDTVSNFNAAVAHAKSLDKRQAQQQNSRNPKGMNMKLSKKSILAIAAGMALTQLGLAEPEANLEGVKLEGDALAAAESEAKEVAAAFDTRVEAAVTAKTTELTAQVAEATTKLQAAEAAVEAAVGKVALAEAAATQLQGQLKVSTEHAAKADAVVKASMSVMSVALGGAADVGASLTGSELIAEHDKMAAQFAAKFPTGRVAAVLPKDPTPAATSKNHMFASMITRKPAQAK